MVNNHEIVIEHTYEKQINASDIAEAVEVVTLDKYFLSISHLAISDEYYFVSPVEKVEVGFSESVFLFSKSGAFSGNLYRSENIIQGLAYNLEKDQLYIAHRNSVVIYDVRQRKKIAKIDTDYSISNITSFDDKIYIGTTVNASGKKKYLIDSYNTSDFSFVKTYITMSYQLPEAFPIVIFRRNSFSSGHGSLYISAGEVNEIYSSENNFTKPVVRFKNLYPKNDTEFNIYFSANQGITGKFATTSFRYKKKMYLLFYDLKNRRQYLSELNDASGLYDDYNHSGNYTPLLTNLSLYMYAHKNQNEKKTNIVLFKIKS